MTTTPEDRATTYDDLTASTITDDQLDNLRAELARARFAVRVALGERDLARELALNVAGDLARARRIAVALENETAELRAAIDRVRAEHAPVPSGDETVCAVCCGGTYDCESVPWPCSTVEALDTPSDAATGPHGAPHTLGGPEGHPSPERPTHDARTHTESAR